MDNVSVSALVNLALSGDNKLGTFSELGSTKVTVSQSRGTTYADGTGSNQCDVFYHDKIGIATGVIHDLNGVVLLDGLGVGLAITKLKLLYIKNLLGGDLELSNDGANVFPAFKASTDTIVLPDDGEQLWIFPGTGITIGGATGKLEFVHAVGGSPFVEIIAAGVR